MGKQQLLRKAERLLSLRADAIRLVGPTEWKALVGEGLGNALGSANAHFVRQPPVVYVKRGQPLDTYVHELLHHLFPGKPHWWIFAASWRICQIPEREWSYKYGYGHGYSVGPERARQLPSRRELLKLAARSAHKKGHACELSHPVGDIGNFDGKIDFYSLDIQFMG